MNHHQTQKFKCFQMHLAFLNPSLSWSEMAVLTELKYNFCWGDGWVGTEADLRDCFTRSKHYEWALERQRKAMLTCFFMFVDVFLA